MMMVFDYPTKKALRDSVGLPLKLVGKPLLNGNYTVTGYNKPEFTGFNQEFYANVVVLNGLIKEVS